MSKNNKYKLVVDGAIVVSIAEDTRPRYKNTFYFNAYVPERKRGYGFKSAKEAYQEGIKFYYSYVPPTDITIDLAGKLYQESRLIEVASATYINDQDFINNQLHKYLGSTMIENLDYDKLVKFRTQLSEDGATNNTINEAMSVLKRIYWYCDLAFKLDLNDIFRHIKTLPYKKSEKAANNFIGYEDFVKVVGNFNHPEHYLKASISFYSGLRPGECSVLKVKDFDFENNTININRTIAKGPNSKRIIKDTTKTGKSRKIVVSSLLMELVQFYLDDLKRTKPINENSYIFNNPGADNFRGPLKTAVKKANIGKEITPHGFRHSYSTILLENNVYIKRVSDNLGHANPNVTLKVYAHVLPKDDDPIVEVMDNLPAKI